jgi:hypothetical protein
MRSVTAILTLGRGTSLLTLNGSLQLRRFSRERFIEVPDEVAEAAAALWALWEVFRFEETEVRDHGDSLLWLGHVRIKGSGSHVELRQEFSIHFEMRGAMIFRARAYLSWEEGLEAAGLRD